ncbi:EcsC family protein [Enterococcus hulanensis]|uniref:EcsC family protein n=1 Tax=Enterococcus hulanensis TaxID=2559929 RepID=UPI00288CD6E5|nr:EcsC family protein [Enterococcus hulanensis]MDT2659232.1 EcsC family protein [Enterococcus hulanensis]
MNTNEDVALKVINESLKLPIVKIDRKEFLVKRFQNKVSDINGLLDNGPQKYFSKDELDAEAQKCINQVTMQSSALSFATGVPGGLAMAATIPADIAQFYAYSLRLAQEISYIYGFEDLRDDSGELTEEGRNALILYLGVMLGVTMAGSAVRVLSKKLSVQVIKKLPQKALTKTIYYPIVKKVLAIFGTKLTKSSFAKGISKAVPIVGGVVSGGINFLSMKPMATKLKRELGKSINYSEEDAKKDLEVLDIDFEIVSDKEDTISPETKNNNVAAEEDVFAKLEKAHQLFEKNIISEEEYQKLKTSLLASF